MFSRNISSIVKDEGATIVKCKTLCVFLAEDQGILPLPEKKVVDPVSTVVDKPYTPDRQDFTVVGTVNATLFRDFPDELQFVVG